MCSARLKMTGFDKSPITFYVQISRVEERKTQDVVGADGALCKIYGKMTGNKKIIFAILSILAFATILYLTFQDGEHTRALSGGVRLWLMDHGIKTTDKHLRSDAHYVEYFVLGLALALFGRATGLKMRWVVLIGCALGFLDECVKILLPIREFELIDLIKDFIGITVAAIVVNAIGWMKGTE